MALPGLTNQGSPGLAASIVDAQEYIWDTSSGGEWIPRIGTSGAATVVTLQSGDVVPVTFASGAFNISGQSVIAEISGQTVVVTGIYISGVEIYVNISGDPVSISGQPVTIASGSWVATSISNQPVNISGQLLGPVTLASGTEVQIFDIADTLGWSGQLASGEIPPLVRVANMSGAEPIVVAANISGQVVNISGQSVVTTLTFPSGLTACRTTYNSGTDVSGACAPPYDFWLESVSVHIGGTPPTISRELVVEAIDGTSSIYNVKILSENPGLNTWTDLLFQPPNPLLLTSGDAIAVSYSNVSGNTIGVKVVTREFIGTG